MKFFTVLDLENKLNKVYGVNKEIQLSVLFNWESEVWYKGIDPESTLYLTHYGDEVQLNSSRVEGPMLGTTDWNTVESLIHQTSLLVDPDGTVKKEERYYMLGIRDFATKLLDVMSEEQVWEIYNDLDYYLCSLVPEEEYHLMVFNNDGRLDDVSTYTRIYLGEQDIDGFIDMMVHTIITNEELEELVTILGYYVLLERQDRRDPETPINKGSEWEQYSKYLDSISTEMVYDDLHYTMSGQYYNTVPDKYDIHG